MTFIGDGQVEPVVETELAALDPPADLGPFGQVVLSPIRRAAIATPLLRLPTDELAYAFNLVRIPATDDRAEARRLVEANAATYERVRAAGGTLYPVSALPLSRRDWREHFGPVYAQLQAAKRRFDPDGVLQPGYDVF
jgi:FAD/FMN-containing dehydrogenase